jgi:hypothetical protein
MHASLLFRWRRKLATRTPARPKRDAFMPVTLAAPVALPPPPDVHRNAASSRSPIEIVLLCGRRVRVDADVDAGKLAAIIAALEAKA